MRFQTSKEKRLIHVPTVGHQLYKQYYKELQRSRLDVKTQRHASFWISFLFWSTFRALRRVIDRQKRSVISAWYMLSLQEWHFDNLKGSGIYKDKFISSPICSNSSQESSIFGALAKTAINFYLFILTYFCTRLEHDRLRPVNQSVAWPVARCENQSSVVRDGEMNCQNAISNWKLNEYFWVYLA